jgi:hypothetical protein
MALLAEGASLGTGQQLLPTFADANVLLCGRVVTSRKEVGVVCNVLLAIATVRPADHISAGSDSPPTSTPIPVEFINSESNIFRVIWTKQKADHFPADQATVRHRISGKFTV